MAYDSPTVDIPVIDESYYASGGAGTIPLVVIATHKNKTHPSGTGIAEGTLPGNSGKLTSVNSQRDLIQYFGYPKFYQDDIGTSVHGYELNEYGLHAAYQYLNVANRVFIINAGVDLNQLQPSNFKPTGLPVPGTFWFNTRTSAFGLQVSDGGSVPGTAWTPRSTTVIDTISELDTQLIGVLGHQDRNAMVAALMGSGHSIVINGTVVALPTNATLVMVASAINAANINSIQAVILRNGGLDFLTLRNSSAGDISIAGTVSNVIIGLFGASYRNIQLPKSSIGTVGSFAIVTKYRDNLIYQKVLPLNNIGLTDSDATPIWVIVGSPEWKRSSPTLVVGSNFTAMTANSRLRINGIVVDFGTNNTTAAIADSIMMAGIPDIYADAVSSSQIRITNTAGGDLTFANDANTPMSQLGISSLKGNELYYAGHTKYPTGSVSGDVWIKTTEYNSGAKWIVSLYSGVTSKWMTLSAPLIGQKTPTGSQTRLQADDAAATALYSGNPSAGVLYVRYDVYEDGTASHEIRRFNGSVWEALSYQDGVAEPVSPASDGTFWYSEDFRADIMVNLDGERWVGYRNHPATALTDAGGPFLQASAPTAHRDGTALVTGDLWIDTSDVENYPALYRYNDGIRRWVAVDKTDQTTPSGIVFDDARQDSGVVLGSGTYLPYSESSYDLQISDFVDPDCVDARLYPDGVLLFNLRYSTGNVKEWRSGYFQDGQYGDVDYSLTDYQVGGSTFPALDVERLGRWVTVSGKKLDGSPYMLRKAQRKMIVESMAAAVNANEDARAESAFFTLIAAPGYVELADEMIALNRDKKEVAFVLIDPPARLEPTAQAIQKWASPSTTGQDLPSSEDYLGTSYAYSAVYYPWGLSTNIDGTTVMIPPSTMAMRVIANNDKLAYQWFAPAGYNRGMVPNATSVGYLTREGEFRATILSEAQRDSLYVNKINPIAYMPGRGLVVYGQKTLHGNTTALDRINVARLINYIRYNGDLLARQFLFEPNTAHTREVARVTFERFLSDLIALDGLYDFLVVCDDSNNTPTRIDRNELWIDIAIAPVKTIEFIIIPLRVRNTGESLSIT